MRCFAPPNHSRLADRFTPRRVGGWNQPQPLSPFAVKSSNNAIQHRCSYFDRNHSYFRFSLVNPFQLTRLTAFISSARSPASQQLSHLTEWREADAPEFSEPLTFFIAPFFMPSLLTLGGAPWRNKWEILEEQFDHRGAKKKKKKNPQYFPFRLRFWARYYAWCAKEWRLFVAKDADYKNFFMSVSQFQWFIPTT